MPRLEWEHKDRGIRDNGESEGCAIRNLELGEEDREDFDSTERTAISFFNVCIDCYVARNSLS